MILTVKQGRGTKIHLHLDGEYTLTVSTAFWAAASIVSGSEISGEEMEQLRQHWLAAQAHDRALRLLSLREHSHKELVDKLARQTDRIIAEQAADRMEELGLLDDRRYAESYTRELSERKKMSPARIRMELAAHGVSRDIAQEVTAALEFDGKAAALSLLQTKYRNALADEKGRRRVFAALQRLGYSYSDIRGAMEECETVDLYGEEGSFEG